MRKLDVHGNLVLGLLLTFACAAAVACTDDGSSPVTAGGGAAGKGGSGASAQGGKSSSAAAGKGGTGGAAQGGSSGETAVGGVAGTAMGGAAGSTQFGMAGDQATAGEAGAPNALPELAANFDAVCTVEASLDCSATAMPSRDKQACLEAFQGEVDFFPSCVEQVKTLLRCLAPMHGANYECVDTMAYPKATTCATENEALNACLSAQ